MNIVAPLLAAGTTFAAIVILGLLAGIWLDRHFGTAYWVLVMLFAGVFVGGFGAWRLVARSFSE